jgi:hypothetical protein
VKTFHGCQLGASISQAPKLHTPLPAKACNTIAIDFMGPLSSGHHLCCVVDHFSRVLKVTVRKETSADKIITVFTAMFSCYFLLRTLVSDNGPFFMLEAFKMLSGVDIEHPQTTALWHQAAGTIEHQNINLVKRLHIAQASGENWNVTLLTPLVTYGPTPHLVIGVLCLFIGQSKVILSHSI